MSRNCCDNRCPECRRLIECIDLEGDVVELRRYYNEPIRALIKHKCNCGQLLLVWLDSHADGWTKGGIDVSYYESFNDEPGEPGERRHSLV